MQEEVFVFPLSFSQERLWFLNQLEPDSVAYNVSNAFRLSGPLDTLALERSINEIVRRHEVLRTTFSAVDGQPFQVITPNLQLNLHVVDLQHMPQAERETEARRLASEEARRPFDLARGPLLRPILLRLTEEEHILLLTKHHIISDGWSMDVLSREMSRLYKAFCRQESSPLPELPIQYADFAVWQRQWLQGEVLQTHIAYWKQQLDGNLPILELPTDRPRPAIQTYRGDGESLLLPKDLVESLQTLSGQEGATLFMTLLTAFNVLLYRYSGQEDILVASPISGRDLVEVEGLIGLFINTLILRTDLSDDPGFRQLLQQVRETVLGAFAHQIIPFEELLKEVKPERSLSHTPLFQVLFVFNDSSVPPLELADLAVSHQDVEGRTAMYDLSLFIRRTEIGLRVEFQYNTDLFEAATISRMLVHFQTLLEGIVHDPGQLISQLPLLTEVERHRMVVDWNNTQVDFPKRLCFPGLFEEQVERTPDSIAVTCAGAQLSYRQLNARANHLARALVENGVGSDLVVAVLEERGIDVLVALIAILKTGGVYLPLDPRHPPQRYSQILTESKASLILTKGQFVPALSEVQGLLPPDARPKILEIERFAHAEVEIENQSRDTSPADLAYVIYTSGSTGLPKGAMVEHRGMQNHLYAKIRDLDLTDADVVAQNASQTFDISVWQFLAALLVGGRVCIFPDELAHDPQRMLRHVESERISILETVPSLLRLMLEEVADRRAVHLDLSSLRWLIPTGEALPPELCRLWLSHYPNIPLLNAYGPTECSDDVTHYPIYQPPARSVVNMPIGRPIANMRMYVLDRQLQPLPIGIAGELYVGGIGVGRGYLHAPERTADVFLPDPFAQEPGARLYRTGDLVRYLPDGNIQFLGRLDHQVKLRGFRIELGEIEAVLGKHPDVREAVVLVREDTPGKKRLVAYVVLDQDRAPMLEELRSFLQEKLPDYMVPVALVRLEALPLTTSGKVDRRALPVPDRDRQVSEETLVVPRDELEFRLVQAWEQVLEMWPVGLRDNFFDLGGHSLLAVRLCAQIEKIAGERLPLATIFQAPTVEQLAMLLRQGEWSAPSSPVVMIQPGDSRPPFFCLPGNLGNVFADIGHLARHLGPDQPFCGLQDGLQAPVRIDKLAAHFIDEMRVVQPEGPYFLGGICSGGVVAFEMAQQLQAQGQQVALLALVEPTPPRTPSLRAPFKLSASIFRRLVRRVGSQSRRISQLSPPERGAYIRLKAKVLANAWAASRYTPRRYPGQIHLFLVRESLGSPERPRLRWCAFAADGTEVYEIPGTHETIVGANDTRVEEAHMRALAELLRGCIDEALAR